MLDFAGGHDAVLLNLGDSFYPNGTLTVAEYRQREAAYAARFGQTKRWHSVLGNHDYRGNATATLEGGATSWLGYKRTSWYSWHEPRLDATFIAVDTNFVQKAAICARNTLRPGTLRQACIDDMDRKQRRQLVWLEQVLADAQKRAVTWIVVFGHHPIFGAGKWAFYQADKNLAAQVFAPLFEKYRVALYVSGHDHVQQLYERAGVRYVISGAGGAELDDDPLQNIANTTERAAVLHLAESGHGFVALYFDTDSALLCAQFLNVVPTSSSLPDLVRSREMCLLGSPKCHCRPSTRLRGDDASQPAVESSPRSLDIQQAREGGVVLPKLYGDKQEVLAQLHSGWNKAEMHTGSRSERQVARPGGASATGRSTACPATPGVFAHRWITQASMDAHWYQHGEHWTNASNPAALLICMCTKGYIATGQGAVHDFTFGRSKGWSIFPATCSDDCGCTAAEKQAATRGKIYANAQRSRAPAGDQPPPSQPLQRQHPRIRATGMVIAVADWDIAVNTPEEDPDAVHRTMAEYISGEEATVLNVGRGLVQRNSTWTNTNSANPESEFRSQAAKYRELLGSDITQARWHSVLGGWDYRGNVSALLSAGSASWLRYPAEEKWYSWHDPRIDATFVALDTNFLESKEACASKKGPLKTGTPRFKCVYRDMELMHARQIRWLYRVLAEAQALDIAWVFVFGHAPLSEHPIFTRAFERYGVDMYLSGGSAQRVRERSGTHHAATTTTSATGATRNIEDAPLSVSSGPGFLALHTYADNSEEWACVQLVAAKAAPGTRANFSACRESCRGARHGPNYECFPSNRAARRASTKADVAVTAFTDAVRAASPKADAVEVELIFENQTIVGAQELNWFPATAAGCAARILGVPTSVCNHTYFVYSDVFPNRCLCVPPDADVEETAPSRRQYGFWYSVFKIKGAQVGGIATVEVGAGSRLEQWATANLTEAAPARFCDWKSESSGYDAGCADLSAAYWTSSSAPMIIGPAVGQDWVAPPWAAPLSATFDGFVPDNQLAEVMRVAAQCLRLPRTEGFGYGMQHDYGASNYYFHPAAAAYHSEWPYGCWYDLGTPSGIFLNVSKSLRFSDRIHAFNFLGIPCSRGSCDNRPSDKLMCKLLLMVTLAASQETLISCPHKTYVSAR